MYATIDPSTIVNLSKSELLEALEYLHKAAYLDALTGVSNRRAFEEEYRLAPQTYRYLLYLDLDGLKQINDRWGHEAGDSYIQRSVNALRLIFRRSSDKIYRLGGDEFVVLSSYLPDLSGVQMFSIGVAEITNGLESALKEADLEMYKVKQSRKNNVIR